VDSTLNNVPNVITSLQQLMKLWVFHGTDAVRSEDVAAMLPADRTRGAVYLSLLCPISYLAEHCPHVLSQARDTPPNGR
jgi:hypothetical protein